MEKLFVKSEDLLKQLGDRKISASEASRIINLAERNVKRFLDGKSTFINLESADLFCLEYNLELPEEVYSRAIVHTYNRYRECSNCEGRIDAVNIECVQCLRRQIRRIERSRSKK